MRYVADRDLHPLNWGVIALDPLMAGASRSDSRAEDCVVAIARVETAAPLNVSRSSWCATLAMVEM
jgi:hypothetical protein